MLLCYTAQTNQTNSNSQPKLMRKVTILGVAILIFREGKYYGQTLTSKSNWEWFVSRSYKNIWMRFIRIRQFANSQCHKSVLVMLKVPQKSGQILKMTTTNGLFIVVSAH